MKNLPDKLSPADAERFKIQFGISYSCAKALIKCPVDEFFFSFHEVDGQFLRGVTLKALATRGYLNVEYDSRSGRMEYYLNNNGHRLRAKLVAYWS